MPDNDAIALRAVSDRAALNELILANRPLVLYQVRRYLAGAPSKKHLKDDLISEGLLALVTAANRLAVEPHPSATNYIALCIKGAIVKAAADIPPGYSARTLKRRAADGIDDLPPPVEVLNEITPCSEFVDPTGIIDLRDSIEFACKDATDREIVSLKERGWTTEDVAQHFQLPVGRIKTRLKQLLKRLDDES